MKRNTLNDLRHEIKFENRVNDKNNFLLSETFLFFFSKNIYFKFLEMFFIFFKDSKEFNCLGNFFAEADTKNHRYTLAKASALADSRGEFRTLIKTFLFSFFNNSGKKLY